MRNAVLRILVVSSLLAALLAGATILGAGAYNVRDAAASNDWDSLVDSYLNDLYFPHNPTAATQDGIHLYDSQIEDYTKTGAAREIDELKEFEKRVVAFPPAGLSATN